MSDPTSQARPEDTRPKLRCPGCAFMVPLPAEICPSCGLNLRTGEKAAEDEPESKGRKIIIGLAALVVIIGLAVVIFGGFSDKPETVKQTSAPVKSGDDLHEAVDIFHDLPDQNIGARPAIILERSQGVADKLEEKNRNMDDTFLSTE